jgi:hypothetical protein
MQREDVMVMVGCAVLGVALVAMAVLGWLPGGA